MAEYYAVLKKAVGGLDPGSAEARRAVYDRARNALIGQLKAIDPPLPASEISRQRLELEEAIRRVERETAAEVRSARVPRASEVAEPASSSVPSAAPEPVPAPQQAGPPSPQDVFRRAIQEAEVRGSAAGRAPERPTAPPEPRYADADAVVEPAQVQRPGIRTEAVPISAMAGPVPDYEDDWQSRNSSPTEAPERYPAPRGGRRSPGRRRQPEYVDDEIDVFEPSVRTRRSRLSTIILLLLIVGMVAALGILGWSQRDLIADLIAEFESGPTQQVASPPAVPAPPDRQPETVDRIGGGTEDSSVRMIGETAVPASPEPAADPIASTIAETPPMMSAGIDGGQKAVLFEEPLDAAAAAAGVMAIDAVINWRFVEDGASGPEISADIEVPERAMTIRLAIRRNTDSTLPASHLVETVITTPSNFPGKGIRSVPRLVLKADENERGEPLIGAAAKVADGFFWIALSAAADDVRKNLELLRQRSWIDLPLVYETGQRAILTFEKGLQGAEVFENAFAAWGTG